MSEYSNPFKQKPITYPSTINYQDMCPRGDTCPGFIPYKTKRGISVYYCHEMKCPELCEQLENCPCDHKSDCQGNQLIKGKWVCNRRKGITIKDVQEEHEKNNHINKRT